MPSRVPRLALRLALFCAPVFLEFRTCGNGCGETVSGHRPRPGAKVGVAERTLQPCSEFVRERHWQVTSTSLAAELLEGGPGACSTSLYITTALMTTPDLTQSPVSEYLSSPRLGLYVSGPQRSPSPHNSRKRRKSHSASRLTQSLQCVSIASISLILYTQSPTFYLLAHL